MHKILYYVMIFFFLLGVNITAHSGGRRHLMGICGTAAEYGEMQVTHFYDTFIA